MDHGDSYWGLYRDYYRDPFSHSVLSTGERKESKYSTRDSQPSVFVPSVCQLGFFGTGTKARN